MVSSSKRSNVLARVPFLGGVRGGPAVAGAVRSPRGGPAPGRFSQSDPAAGGVCTEKRFFSIPIDDPLINISTVSPTCT